MLQATGYERRIEVVTNNFTTLPQMVIGTNRVATMHSRLARMFATYYPQRLLPPPFELPRMEFAMQWNRFFDSDPSHQWLRKLVREIASPRFAAEAVNEEHHASPPQALAV